MDTDHIATDSTRAVSGRVVADPVQGDGVARHSVVMAVWALVSRGTGFVRTAALGAVLGAGLVGDAYATATMLPGIFYEVLLGGTLVGILIPLLMQHRSNDPDRGIAYTQRLLTLGVLVFAVASLAAVTSVPLMVRILSSGGSSPASRGLLTVWSLWVLPTIFCYGLGALLSAVLNAHGHFTTPTWAPIANNLILVTTSGVFLLLPTAPSLTPETISSLQTLVIGVGTLLGVVAQTVVLWLAMRRVGLRWRWRLDLRVLGLGQLGGLVGWLMCYVAASQVSVFVVIGLTRAAGDRGDAGTFIYSNGWLMLMMGYGVAALPIITALQPRLSAPTDGYLTTFRQLATGTRMITFVLAPVTAAFLVLASPLAMVLFAWHRYTTAAAADTAIVIAVAGLCLIPYAISQAQTFAFFALGDARTPALLNLPVVVARIGIDLLLYQTVANRWVAAAMMGGNAVTYLMAAIIGWWFLRRRGLHGPGTNTVADTSRALLAAALAAVPTGAVVFTLRQTLGSGKVASVATLAIGGLVLLVLYLALAALVRNSVCGKLLTTVREKLGLIHSRLVS